jgi:hypothetical protein
VRSDCQRHSISIPSGSEQLREFIQLAIFKASVVFPLTATFILITQVQLLAFPDTFARCVKIGPTPPVLTAQPSIAKAAITAHTDLIKKSHFIFLGLINSRGN